MNKRNGIVLTLIGRSPAMDIVMKIVIEDNTLAIHLSIAISIYPNNAKISLF